MSSYGDILKNIDHYLVKISLIVLTIIGIIGNSLVFYILTRKKFLKESIFRYFIASEIVASLSLVLVWMHYVPILLKWDVPVLFCKIYSTMLSVFYSFYPWISVLNSIDRLLTLKYPFGFKFIKKFKYQASALLIVLLALILVNIPRVLYIEKKENPKLCVFNDLKIGLFISVENLFISNIIPLIIMLISTFLIISFLIKQKRKLIQNRINYRREKDFIKSVLTMDLWFILLYSPYCILFVLRFLMNSNYSNNTDLWNLLLDSSIILAYFETSCNFFVYLLCNKLFRRYFFSFIRYYQSRY